MCDDVALRDPNLDWYRFSSASLCCCCLGLEHPFLSTITILRPSLLLCHHCSFTLKS